MVSNVDLTRFKSDGFLLLKGVFSAGEVARFREAGADAPRTTNLAAMPDISALWADGRIVSVAKALLGEPVTFFGDASYAHEKFSPHQRISGRHLHHDAKGTYGHLFNRHHAPTSEPFPIVRFAIYLQDHTSQSGGLKVVPGSHQADSSDFNQERLAYFDVPTEPGDLVVFCNRILHSPYALRLKQDPLHGLAPLEEIKLSAETPEAFLPTPLDRRVIFIDYAAHSDLADIYIKSHALNPNAVAAGLVQLAETLAATAQGAGVSLRLDAAIVEAMRTIKRTADNGRISATGMGYLSALPRLCELSQEWTHTFNFVPAHATDPKATYLYILERTNALLQMWKTKLPDLHMAAYDVIPARAAG